MVNNVFKFCLTHWRKKCEPGTRNELKPRVIGRPSSQVLMSRAKFQKFFEWQTPFDQLNQRIRSQDRTGKNLALSSRRRITVIKKYNLSNGFINSATTQGEKQIFEHLITQSPGFVSHAENQVLNKQTMVAQW